jgi:mannosyltransferase OCH1-like enzyme
MIPKIIHRMWLDKKYEKNTRAPSKYDNLIKSFDTMNPDFTSMFWNRHSIKKLFNSNKNLRPYKKIWY